MYVNTQKSANTHLPEPFKILSESAENYEHFKKYTRISDFPSVFKIFFKSIRVFTPNINIIRKNIKDLLA